MILGFIGDMYGPHFLALYFGIMVVAFIVIVSLYRIMNWFLHTRCVLPQLDAYDYVLIKGGVAGVLRLSSFSLGIKQLVTLKISKAAKFSILKKNPDLSLPKEINDIEAFVWSVIHQKESSWLNLLKSPTAHAKLEAFLINRISRLEKAGLLWSKAHAQKVLKYKSLVILLVLFLGAYKLIYALQTGHTNVGGLIFLMIIFFLATFKLKPRGIRRNAVRLIKDVIEQEGNSYKIKIRDNKAIHKEALLVLALFGFKVMAELRWKESYHNYLMYNARRTAFGFGCAIDCGMGCGADGSSSGSGGSSCGGGCGGCGND